MAQFVVRDLEEDVKTRLQRRAAQRGRSLEAEVRDILRDAVKDDDTSSRVLGSRIASRFIGLRLKESELTVLPPRKLKPARLGK